MRRIWLAAPLMLVLAGAGPLDSMPCSPDNQGQAFIVLRDPAPAETTQFAKDKATLIHAADQWKCQGTAWVMVLTTPVYEIQQ